MTMADNNPPMWPPELESSPRTKRRSLPAGGGGFKPFLENFLKKSPSLKSPRPGSPVPGKEGELEGSPRTSQESRRPDNDPFVPDPENMPPPLDMPRPDSPRDSPRTAAPQLPEGGSVREVENVPEGENLPEDEGLPTPLEVPRTDSPKVTTPTLQPVTPEDHPLYQSDDDDLPAKRLRNPPPPPPPAAPLPAAPVVGTGAEPAAQQEQGQEQEEVAEEVPEVPVEVPEEVAEEVLEEPVEVPEEVPEEVPVEVPVDVPEEVPEEIPEVPEEVPEQEQEDDPSRLPPLPSPGSTIWDEPEPWSHTFEAFKNFVESAKERTLSWLERHRPALFTITKPIINLLHRILLVIFAIIDSILRPAWIRRVLKILALIYVYNVTIPNFVTNLRLALEPAESLFRERQAALSGFPPPALPLPPNTNTSYYFPPFKSSIYPAHPSAALPVVEPLLGIDHLHSTLLSYTRNTSPYAVLNKNKKPITPFSSTSEITSSAISQLNRIQYDGIFTLFPFITWLRHPSSLANKIDAVVLAHATLVHPAARCRYHATRKQPDWYGTPLIKNCGIPPKPPQRFRDRAARELSIAARFIVYSKGWDWGFIDLAKSLLSRLTRKILLKTSNLVAFGPRWEEKIENGYGKVLLWDIWGPRGEELRRAWREAVDSANKLPSPLASSAEPSTSPREGEGRVEEKEEEEEGRWKRLTKTVARFWDDYPVIEPGSWERDYKKEQEEQKEEEEVSQPQPQPQSSQDYREYYAREHEDPGFWYGFKTMMVLTVEFLLVSSLSLGLLPFVPLGKWEMRTILTAMLLRQIALS